MEPSPSIPPPPGLGGGGSSGTCLTEDATKSEGEGAQAVQDGAGEDVEAEVCFICASPVLHNSVAPCNHRTCHICALRLRALYKTRACAHCRAEAKYVIFTDDSNKRYEDFTDADFQKVDEVLGVKYENKEIHDDTVLLLRYNCPDVSCDIACWGWPDLHRHVKGVHHMVMCDLCTRNKKVFTHEHELFTVADLRKHEKFGDDNPGAVDQSGFKGHPECGFCRQRFYGDDELYTHCREKHERCHICDRRNQGRQQQYFIDYNSLEQHFRRDHFTCADQECLDKKFVVFESEMDLKAHQLGAHPNGLSKDARKDARRVDISTFDYRRPHQDNRGGRREREGRGSGRGRDPNTEAIPPSTAQPLRRDELAYQRQMAIQSAQSVSTRTFGGQLTSPDAYAARPGGRGQEPSTLTAPRNHTITNTSFPSIDSLHLNPNSNTSTRITSSPAVGPALTPQEQARRLRHSAVTERASNMLKSDQQKLTDFRNNVSSYRTSAITATQLIDTFFSLFDVPSAELGKLVRELAEIYEDDAKRNDLLKAWNDWRAINEDYPSLPGPSGVLPGSSAAAAGSGGHRVLKLKSSTAQSSRSAVSKQGSWGNAADSNPFPAMPAASANRAGPGRGGATPWVSSSSRPSPASSRPSSKPPVSRNTNAVSSDAFPALPAAPIPNTTILGKTRGAVRWDDNRVANKVNAWGGGSSSNANPSAAASETEGDPEPSAGGKKKGNKNKKQVLYKLG
ncbi:c2h2 finger domain [Lasallia pustulata]|uniref:RING-type E3 ubiquitin transferase n=1 Tax=Lasallia pustulata TaxID=136370 RepID=A0A1W5CSV7_9LECA|nr:c2h2 finger domain [Lasallia pustulata]